MGSIPAGIELPKQCGYKSIDCDFKTPAAYEVKLIGTGVGEWTGFVCQKCLIALQKVVYRNNAGKLDFRMLKSEEWQSYVSKTDPTHQGRNDHLA